MSSYKYLTEEVCSGLNINFNYIKSRNNGFTYVIQIIHYFRMKDMYKIYLANKKYNRKYIYNYCYFDFDNIFKTCTKYDDMENEIEKISKATINIIKIFISNAEFYQLDKNINMYKVSKNVIHTLYNYLLIFQDINCDNIIETDENNRLSDIIYAFNLYYYILNNENMLSDYEINKLYDNV